MTQRRLPTSTVMTLPSLGLALVLGALSCGRASNSAPPAQELPAPVTAATASKVEPAPAVSALAASPPSATPELVFTGMCDASAAVPISERAFVVANDEDNVLRAYDVERPGPPIWSVDISSSVGVHAKPAKPGKPLKEAPEADIEAATRVGELAFWMTSHGRNSSGKPKPERLLLFATSIPEQSSQLRVVGSAYTHLLDDLLSEPRLSRFGLAAAAQLAPKAPGGLNLEGMTARIDGGVFIGFRNPLPEGRAIVVPLLNPEELVKGQRARFGDPHLLDLGGLGVRAISRSGDQYLLIAGPFDSTPGSRLFRWSGAGQPVAIERSELSELNPEGFFSPKGRAETLLLSDDGARLIDGEECKRLKDPTLRTFRARWIKP